MKETYENAEEVIVWLGPESENSALAMAKIAKVIFLDWVKAGVEWSGVEC